MLAAKLQKPQFQKKLLDWIERALEEGSQILATSNQGTLLRYKDEDFQLVIKAAMGNALTHRLRLATLRREYAAYRRLEGVANIPRCYGLLDDRYLLLEYIEGSPYRHAKWRDREAWFRRFRETIEAIHARGVAHGDLKSKSNIIVTTDESPCVIDFGTAIVRRPGQHPLNRFFYRYACRLDKNAWVKHKYQGDYSAASEQDREWLRYSALEALLRKTRRRG